MEAAEQDKVQSAKANRRFGFAWLGFALAFGRACGNCERHAAYQQLNLFSPLDVRRLQLTSAAGRSNLSIRGGSGCLFQ